MIYLLLTKSRNHFDNIKNIFYININFSKFTIECYNTSIMEKLKSILFLIIILVIIILVGYWAVFTIEPGNIHVEKQKQEELAIKNKELEQKIKELKNEITALTPVKKEVSQEKNIEDIIPKISNNTPLKHQGLINDLQKLIDNRISMKLKSRGTRVGGLQTFLNIYNNTSKRIDNDYGKGTKTAVANFQKKEGLTIDGEAGPNTFRKMIDWLKKQ